MEKVKELFNELAEYCKEHDYSVILAVTNGEKSSVCMGGNDNDLVGTLMKVACDRPQALSIFASAAAAAIKKNIVDAVEFADEVLKKFEEDETENEDETEEQED